MPGMPYSQILEEIHLGHVLHEYHESEDVIAPVFSCENSGNHGQKFESTKPAHFPACAVGLLT
jgi:hypothetical protein